MLRHVGAHYVGGCACLTNVKISIHISDGRISSRSATCITVHTICCRDLHSTRFSAASSSGSDQKSQSSTHAHVVAWGTARMERGTSARVEYVANGPVSWSITASGAAILVTCRNGIGSCCPRQSRAGSSKMVRHTAVGEQSGWAVEVRISAVVNELHPLKARASMVVTESGMVMLTNELH